MVRNAIKGDLKNIYKTSCVSDLTMFELTAGRLHLDINHFWSIYTDRYVGNEGIYIVFAL